MLPHEQCLTCFSSWVTSWFLSHLLWCVLHCTKISHLKNMITLSIWMPKWTWLSHSVPTHFNECPRYTTSFFNFLACERSLPCPHCRCERGTDCKRSWNGDRLMAPAMMHAVGGRPKGAASWGCCETHREAPFPARAPWCSKWHQSHDCCSTKDRSEVYVVEQRCSYRCVPFLDVCVWLLSSSVMTFSRSDHL